MSRGSHFRLSVVKGLLARGMTRQEIHERISAPSPWTKEQFLRLPEITYRDLLLELTVEQRGAYDALGTSVRL